MLERFRRAIQGSQLSPWHTLAYVAKRGGGPFLRGGLWLLLRGRLGSFPFFLGRGTTVYCGHLLKVGKSCVIGDFAWINAASHRGVVLGNRVTVREFAWIQLSSHLSQIGESLEIGDNTYIGPRCSLGAGAPVRIGSNCLFGGSVQIIAEQHRFEGGHAIMDQQVSRRGVTIGNHCWIGNNAIILDGVELGEGCVVGAGAVVTKSFPANTVVAGVPARELKRRSDK